MNTLVKPNQSAFIQTRLIHENYKAVHLTAKFLHRHKVLSALLKVDIAKAYNMVNWQFLLSLLGHLGFSRCWLNWVSLMLCTASTKVILNGAPGLTIYHARGLRREDTLSPLLFILIMEVLNALLQLADARGHFNHWMLRSRKGLSCTLMMWYCSRHQPAGCQGNS